MFRLCSTQQPPKHWEHVVSWALWHLPDPCAHRCDAGRVLCAGAALVSGKWNNQWLFWVGPISGGIIAALVYELLFNFEQKGEQSDLVSGRQPEP
jgi:Major intrinsic protein